MSSKYVRILTICLFSGLIGVFVAYKSGYFSQKAPVNATQLIALESFKSDDPVIKYNSDSLLSLEEYEGQNILASSSKSILAVDGPGIAKKLSLNLFKDWRIAFDLQDSVNSDRLNALDSISMDMVRQIDSLAKKRFMLMVSSKSLVSVNQTHLSDSLMRMMKKALRIRMDSLENKPRQ
ncbi:MAG: hypothetical protein HEP71_26800 [Roseivirga sp.]|nr:hypothetical protein [Roseivirga sp.]